MLLKFKVKNYRSLRDEAVLDMEAAGIGDHKECLLKYKNNVYLPVISINGKMAVERVMSSAQCGWQHSL